MESEGIALPPALPAEDGQRVCEWREGYGGERTRGVGGLPDAAARGAQVDRVAGGVVGVGRNGGDAASEVAVGRRDDCAGAEWLPRGGEVCRLVVGLHTIALRMQ